MIAQRTTSLLTSPFGSPEALKHTSFIFAPVPRDGRTKRIIQCPCASRTCHFDGAAGLVTCRCLISFYSDGVHIQVVSFLRIMISRNSKELVGWIGVLVELIWDGMCLHGVSCGIACAVSNLATVRLYPGYTISSLDGRLGGGVLHDGIAKGTS
jgi:hypothetical protein